MDITRGGDKGPVVVNLIPLLHHPWLGLLEESWIMYIRIQRDWQSYSLVKHTTRITPPLCDY